MGTRTSINVNALGFPTLQDAQDAINAALAPLLSQLIGAFAIQVTDQAPQTVREVKAFIDIDSAGTTITTPFQVVCFQADIDPTLDLLLNNFRAANPGYFFAPPIYIWSVSISQVPFRCMAFLLYNTVAANGAANWDPGYIASGGSGGTIPWPGAFSPFILTNNSGGTHVRGSICYLSGNDAVGSASSVGGGPDVGLAQARVRVMCLDTVLNGAQGRYVAGGLVIGLAGLVAEGDYWLSTTPGVFSATPDLTPGNWLGNIGQAVSTTELYFSPSIPQQN